MEPWLDKKCPPDPVTMNRRELIDGWHDNRTGKEGANVVWGQRCADEMMKRLLREADSGKP
jgi:hypothetical protein